MKHYDIKNISAGKLAGTIALQLPTGDPRRGFEHVSIPEGQALLGVPEYKLSEVIWGLAKARKGRPPVIKLVEVDVEARAAEEKGRIDLLLAREEKRAKALAMKLVAVPEVQEEEPKAKKRKLKELTSEEQSALEAGKPLPSDNEEDK